MPRTSPYHPDYTPHSKGTLHSFANEKDNCGMGAIAHLGGVKSYEIIERAIDSVCNMTHRGAIDADGKTGDGSGVLTQIPRALFTRELKTLGYQISDISDLAVGVFFLPSEDSAATQSSNHFLSQFRCGQSNYGFCTVYAFGILFRHGWACVL